MGWTKEQQCAITDRGRNILVAAAAGSGKTAVLVERIKQLVIKDKVDIDRFLITSFTNAASEEMKERLETAINQAMEEPGADRGFLKRQLTLLPKANISTFHTFSMEIVHKYFYVAGLEPGLKICDETERDIMEREAVNELFERRFAEDYEAFTEFLNKYSGDRNEDTLKNNIIALYKKMRSIPHYMIWGDEKTELLHTASPICALGLAAFVMADTKKTFEKACRFFDGAAEILKKAALDRLYESVRADIDRCVGVFEKCSAQDDFAGMKTVYDAFGEKLLKVDIPRRRADEKPGYALIEQQFTALRNQGKKALDDLKKRYYKQSPEIYDAALRESYEDTKYLISLVKELESIFREKKNQKNRIDFDDVMHDAIDILQDDKVAGEYRDKFRYIFIDEFQDSNLLQEMIIARITRGDNLFMVGDVKQSIYRFRQADPDLFKHKYTAYAAGDVQGSIKIDLNTNFRSKNKVIDLVNGVFASLMRDYDENAALKVNPAIDGTYPGLDAQVHLIDLDAEENKPQAPDEIVDKTEREMELIAKIIAENRDLTIYDVKKDCMRKVEYGDIAVLVRNGGMIGELEKFLNNQGIPAYGKSEGGYFDTVEIQVFVNLLKIIDNTRADVPLISVMRCPVFGFTVRELSEIRIFAGKSPSYYDAVQRYRKEGPRAELVHKLTAMLEKIQYWKELKHTVSLEELVRILLYDTGYFDYCSSLPAGKQRISNLRLLVEKAAQYEEDHYGGLYGFLSYVEAMKKSSRPIEEAKVLSEESNLVQIMTIHKSKGLEFPVVILAETGKRYRNQREIRSPSMHKNLAIGLPQVNKEQKWYRSTLLQQIINQENASDHIEEEIRILYVAMTRAMDRFILTGTCHGRMQGTFSHNSPLEMLYGAMETAGAEVIYEDFSQPAFFSKKQAAARLGLAELLDTDGIVADDAMQAQIEERLSYTYPHAHLNEVKSKYSVTEINKQGSEETQDLYLIKPTFSETKRKLDAAQVGTAIHLVMEKLDFAAALAEGSPYITRTADRLHADGLLIDEERAAVDLENIAAFFNDPVGIRAASSKTLEKEREFLLQTEVDGVTTLVQGIIDCFFEEEDGLVLIDYKNSHMGGSVSDQDIIERYAKQIQLYRKALEVAKEKQVKEAYLYLFMLRTFVRVL